MIITEADSGRIVEVDSGGTLTLRLNESPKTGYRWVVVSADGLKKLDDHFELGASAGAAGLRVMRFKAPQKGMQELRLQNWREWEGEGSVLRRFFVQVSVR
jgi:inhibitor of cysteine peptidase